MIPFYLEYYSTQWVGQFNKIFQKYYWKCIKSLCTLLPFKKISITWGKTRKFWSSTAESLNWKSSNGWASIPGGLDDQRERWKRILTPPVLLQLLGLGIIL
jgi:hypothetical protein